MKSHYLHSPSQPANRLTLEQKIRRIALRYRQRERRRQQRLEKISRVGSLRGGWLSLACAVAVVTGASFPNTVFSVGLFERANENYAAGHFVEAAQGFEQVIARYGYSAPVLFDLGNAWLKAGQPGRAILNYERALLLAPRDSAIAQNLRLAREQAGLPARTPSAVMQAASLLSVNTWTWLGAGALVVMCLSIFSGRLRPTLPRSAVRMLVAGSAATLIAVIAVLAIRWPERERAVVLSSDCPARIAPAEAAGISFKLPAGEIVQARKSHGGFVLVQTADCRSGWVNQGQVAKVMVSDYVPEPALNNSIPAAKSNNS
jgi:tetratricopeptide (TPR) repeat protein